ncbi:hypothetical protein QQX09_03210 [Demequina sp. SYSU T00192]|uniref:Uncharacterized protein n=1 Tax=Demequina litoralis TaxID=3051660 RepID=A0ABT8G788_9MICO|nr:hypothetical protein [Demequina sp. SYSU T00192]MDN4474862.1 hypothetical protein [Demequina sp. SYSU T00192]
MPAGTDKPHLGVFDPAPTSEWDEAPDDDAGDVIPPVAVDMEILHPIERHDD